MSELAVRNRQRVRRVDTTLLRRIVRSLLSEQMGVKGYELGIHLVGLVEMAQANKRYLDHPGSTDVITFNHSEDADPDSHLHGELLVCIDEAVLNAARFRVKWQSEMMRYIIHGILHLQGHDDKRTAARRKMKREENRLLRALARRHSFSKLERAGHRA